MLDTDTYDEIVQELGLKRAYAAALDEKLKRMQRRQHAGPGGLLYFVEHFWKVLEPGRKFVSGWALSAMCQHLEAVSRGDIKRLLINVPPGSMKSLLVNVFFPAWEWGAMGRPDLKYLAFSYASHLTERDNQKLMDLVSSKEYQRLYGNVFSLRDRGKIKMSTSGTGSKFASSVQGTSTGERGDRVMLDDPHNVAQGESDAIRQNTVRFFRESMSNRLNDIAGSAIIVIMQRVNEGDVSGEILANDLGYVHLCIPMLYEKQSHCTTHLNGKQFWTDPRSEEDECFWPERFPDEAVDECLLMGEFAFASQYQQRPEPRGGGLFKRDYWEMVRPDALPKKGFDFVIGSVDGAFTEKTQNDPSAMTMWGCFRDEHGNRSAVLLDAWRKWVPLHGKCRPRQKGEGLGEYKDDTQHEWGLVEWIAYTLQRHHADRVLIENKASGHDIITEMRRLFPSARWTIEAVDPAGLDKHARAIRVQPMFAQGLVYQIDREEAGLYKFGQLVLDEMAIFPRGKYDDLTDTATQAIWWLRQNRYLVPDQEYRAAAIAKARQYKPIRPLYAV